MWFNLKDLVKPIAIMVGKRIGKGKNKEEKLIGDARSLATDPEIQVELGKKNRRDQHRQI